MEVKHCHVLDLPDGYPVERLLEIAALRSLQNDEMKERMPE